MTEAQVAVREGGIGGTPALLLAHGMGTGADALCHLRDAI